MLGYIINARVGAFTYNLFHHKAVAIGCWLAGIVMQHTELQFVGLLLFGHSAFDRLFGYGLKYADNFKNTHLGWIGKHKQAVCEKHGVQSVHRRRENRIG